MAQTIPLQRAVARSSPGSASSRPRHRHRRCWRPTREGRAGSTRITRFDPSSTPPSSPARSTASTPRTTSTQRLIVADRPLDLDGARRHADGARRRRVRPARHDPYSMSVITASSSGGNEFGQKEIQNLWGKGPIFVGAYQSIAWFYAATTGQIVDQARHEGPLRRRCHRRGRRAGGPAALAARTIRRGVGFVVSGGTEAPIGPYALTCQLRNGLLSTPARTRRRVSGPSTRRANGYVPGEGGAILIVEDAGVATETRRAADLRRDPRLRRHQRRLSPRQARARRHAVRARDADGARGGRRRARRSRRRLRRRGRHAGVGSTWRSRRSRRSSAPGRGVPVTAPKSMVGRLYAGGASLDVAAAVLAMRDGVIPPTINLD